MALGLPSSTTDSEDIGSSRLASVNQRVSNIVALVVAFVWSVSFLADIPMKSYEPSPYIHAIMLAVVGAAVSNSMIKRNGKEQ